MEKCDETNHISAQAVFIARELLVARFAAVEQSFRAFTM